MCKPLKFGSGFHVIQTSGTAAWQDQGCVDKNLAL